MDSDYLSLIGFILNPIIIMIIKIIIIVIMIIMIILNVKKSPQFVAE